MVRPRSRHHARWLAYPKQTFMADWSWDLMRFTALASLLTSSTYFLVRLYCLVEAEKADRRQLALAWFFVALEFLSFSPNCLIYLVRAAAVQRPARPVLRSHGDDAPPVVVLITCCGEDTEVILDTAKAACALNYPPKALRVLVLDDGRSNELSHAIDALRRSNGNIYYESRVKGPVKDYKAGNLNYGLRISGIFDPPAEFVAGLDADMIPEPDWLNALVPHLVENPRLALANAPQNFYNVPQGDPLGQDLTEFYVITEVIHDALGIASCSGSGWIARREALEQIHGFPTDTLSEDICCSSLLRGAGWQTAYINGESLQWGCVPDSFLGHVKQRTRWAIGNIQTANKLRFYIWGPQVKNMGFLQRTAGFMLSSLACTNQLRVFSFIGLPLALLSSYPFVLYSNSIQLRWLIRSVALCELSGALHTCTLMSIAGGPKPACVNMEADSWMIPYYAVSFIRSILPSSFGGQSASFTATGSLNVLLNERSASARAPLRRRLFVFIFHYHAWVHIVLVISCFTGFSLAFARAYSRDSRSFGSLHQEVALKTAKDKLVYLLTRVGWPPLLWGSLTISCFKPLIYMVWPPDTPIREDLLKRDVKTGVAHPKKEAKAVNEDFEAQASVAKRLLVWTYTLLCFVFSWFL